MSQSLFRINQTDATFDELIANGFRPLASEKDYWIVLAKDGNVEHYGLMKILNGQGPIVLLTKEELNVVLS